MFHTVKLTERLFGRISNIWLATKNVLFFTSDVYKNYNYVALCSFVVPTLLSVFFSIYVVVLALWSLSSIAAHFAFCFSSCVVMIAVWSLSTAAHFAFCFTSCD